MSAMPDAKKKARGRRGSIGNRKANRLVRKYTASKLVAEAKNGAGVSGKVNQNPEAGKVLRVVKVSTKEELESKESPSTLIRKMSFKAKKLIKKAEEEKAMDDDDFGGEYIEEY